MSPDEFLGMQHYRISARDMREEGADKGILVLVRQPSIYPVLKPSDSSLVDIVMLLCLAQCCGYRYIAPRALEGGGCVKRAASDELPRVGGVQTSSRLVSPPITHVCGFSSLSIRTTRYHDSSSCANASS